MPDRAALATNCTTDWRGALSSRTFRCVAILVIASLLATGSRADQLALITGRSIEGKVSFDAKDALVALPKGQPSQRIGLNDVLALRMDGRAEKPARRAVRLVNGAVLAAESILEVNEREARIKRSDSTLLNIPLALVASVIFETDKKLDAPSPEFVGVQTRTGDLSEGTIVSITEASVRISSVLFGILDLHVDKTVHAVQFHPVGTSDAMYIIRTTDGSAYHASSFTVDSGRLTVQLDKLGSVAVAGDSVRTIDLGPAAADLVAKFTPANAEGVVILRPDESRTIAVDQKYRALLLNLRVPTEYVPTRSVRFIVTADGKEVARTDPMTSLDPPKSLTLPIDNVKQITLRIEATGPTTLGTAGAITGGRLIRKS
jgi:hypothetical protein